MPEFRLLAFVVKELKEVLPPTVFFAAGFNLIVLTIDLILADYLSSFANFMIATMAALVVGKSVLVANAIPVLRRFDTAPVIQAVLFKTIFIGRWFSLCGSWRSLGSTFSPEEPSGAFRNTCRLTLPGTALPLSRSGSSFFFSSTPPPMN